MNIILVTVSTALLIDTGARRRSGQEAPSERSGQEVPSEAGAGKLHQTRSGRRGQSAEDRSARAEQAKWGREGEVPKC